MRFLQSIFLGICLSYCTFLFGEKKLYSTSKVTGESIKIDASDNEQAWNQVKWEGDFVQSQPFENKPPSQITKFKILYDDNNLFIFIRASDSSPDSIAKRMSRRDESEGDYLAIMIDSYHDLRTAFGFAVNAAGVKSDGIASGDNSNFDLSWDPIWYVSSKIEVDGWVAEMKIPLTQLRFGKHDEYTWGIQIMRYFFRKGETSSWQFISPNAPGFVSFFGELNGISGINPRKQKDIIPYVVTNIDRYKKEKGNPFATGKDRKISGGLDGKFGITNDLTLDLTVNPDFGQVEADPSVVNLSTFETFYDEKRPFFIEGKNIMNYSMTVGGPLMYDNLFYSRRIGHTPYLSPDLSDVEYLKAPKNTKIIDALKLTGKTKNGWSIGALESLTNRETAEIDSLGKRRFEPVEPLTNYFLGRLQKDFKGSDTRLGGMFTATNRQLNNILFESLHKSAYTGGFDVDHQWKNKTYYISFKSIFSNLKGTKEAILNTQTEEPRFFQRPDAPHLKVDSSKTSLTGFGGTISGGRAGNSKWPFMLWVSWRSPSLELNDMGYLYSPDIIQQIFWVGYQNFKPFGIFRNIFLNFNQWYGTTFGLEKIYFGGNFSFSTEFKNFWNIGAGGSYDTKSLSTSELRGGPSLILPPNYSIFYNFSTNSRKSLILSLGGNHNIWFDHYFTYHNFFANLTWRISEALKIDLSPNINIIKQELAYVDNIEDPDTHNMRYIRGSLNQIQTNLTIRINYNITPDFTIQYYGMPFISAGDYEKFKYISNSKAAKFSDRFINYKPNQITKMQKGDTVSYSIDENLNGHPDYSFDNPDFNVFEYRSNLIARWEYLPGSTIYLVWSFSQNRTKNVGIYSFRDDINEIFKVCPYNIFLIKISYRFGL